MKKGRLALFIIFTVFTFSNCSFFRDDVIDQGADYWIVLEKKDAIQKREGFGWRYNLKKAGKYDLQIILTGETEGSIPNIRIDTDSISLSEIPDKVFVLEKGEIKQTVLQFRSSLTFYSIGVKTLRIGPDISFDSIRIIPNYRNKLGFGSGKYHEEWLAMHNSEQKKESIKWLKEAKYGMFIHWGLYSQAGGIWKGKRMENSGIPGPAVSEWLMYKFQIPRHEYAELAKSFRPDKSFAQIIARLAKDAGMKYVVITSKHHDGFALFNSTCSSYDMVDATPYHADAIKELYDACLMEGLEFGVYYSHGNDWYDGTDGNYANVKKRNDSLGILTHLSGKNLWDPSSNTFSSYIENKALTQIRELLDLLPDLRLIWFDGEGNITEEQAFRFYKTIYEKNPGVIVNRRIGYDFGDYLDAGDNVIPSQKVNMLKYWETCGTTNNSWGYKSYDKDWKTPVEMLYYLIDIASKGGNYLLNVGPDGKGLVPDSAVKNILEMGKWLKINGEAIYGTSRWKIIHEGQGETLLSGTGHRAKYGFNRNFLSSDFWFTSKKNTVYVISLAEPGVEVHIKSLNQANAKIENISLLGEEEELIWKQTEEELIVKIPFTPVSKRGYVLKIKLEQESIE